MMKQTVLGARLGWRSPWWGAIDRGSEVFATADEQTLATVSVLSFRVPRNEKGQLLTADRPAAASDERLPHRAAQREDRATQRPNFRWDSGDDVLEE